MWSSVDLCFKSPTCMLSFLPLYFRHHYIRDVMRVLGLPSFMLKKS